MRYLYSILAAAIVISTLNACSDNEQKPEANNADKELLAKAKTYFSPLPLIAKNADNKKTKQKISLGHKLYFDNQLSLDQTQSCNSCHNLATYGVDNLPTSPGDKGENGDRNSPTVLNAALHTSQFWDGRSKDVEEQAGLPILNPVEMAIPDEAFLVDRLKKDPDYPTLFKEAFPDDADALTYANIRNSLALFERELLTPGVFDTYLKGDVTALSQEEKDGMNAFIDAQCITCHSGALLGGNLFQKFAVYGNYWEYTKGDSTDTGRFKETGVEGDKYMYKVPSLRNVTETYPYLHDGSVADLKEVIRIMGKAQLNVDLSNEQIASINEFLKTLSPENPIRPEYQSAPQ